VGGCGDRKTTPGREEGTFSINRARRKIEPEAARPKAKIKRIRLHRGQEGEEPELPEEGKGDRKKITRLPPTHHETHTSLSKGAMKTVIWKNGGADMNLLKEKRAHSRVRLRAEGL